MITHVLVLLSTQTLGGWRVLSLPPSPARRAKGWSAPRVDAEVECIITYEKNRLASLLALDQRDHSPNMLSQADKKNKNSSLYPHEHKFGDLPSCMCVFEMTRIEIYQHTLCVYPSPW